MCKWCEDQICYYSSTPGGIVLVTSCRFCGKILPTSRSQQQQTGSAPEVANNRTPSRLLPTIADRKDTLTIITKMKGCNLSRSMTSSISPTNEPPNTPRKLPPIVDSNNPTGVSTPNATSSKSASPNLQPFPPPCPPRSLAYLKREVDVALRSNNWRGVEEFFEDIFSSTSTLSSAFKDFGELNAGKMFAMYDTLCDLPGNVHKVVLKSLISCLLARRLSATEEHLDALFVALMNPLFCDASSYLVFAHILRRASILHDQQTYQLIIWLSRVSEKRFKGLLRRIQDFISCRLFPPSETELPPIQKCLWWIPSATKVLALLRAASELCTPRLVSYMEFYNNSVDLLDLLNDYNEWQNSQAAQSRFSFCQYPFILSITAKRKILHQDSEQQMVLVARNALLAEAASYMMEPNIDMLFLTVNVRRSHLVSDSLEELSNKSKELKKKLKVSFIGEPGLDMGGLKKEWFLLLIREIFQPNYGMFQLNKHSMMYWFCSNSNKSLHEFNLVGKLTGLAVYNGINLDVKFPTICYRKLLSPAIVPSGDPHASVGITKVMLEDVMETMPDVGSGFKDLLEYDGNVEEDFCLTFQIAFSQSDVVCTQELKNNGKNIPVTNDNRKEYMELYMDFLFNRSIYDQFQAFYMGFHGVCASNALIMFQPEEIELLVCGSPVFDMTSLKNVVEYDGYANDDETILHFWEVILEEYDVEQQKQFLSFSTGSDRLPVGGINEMQFKISRLDDTESLPMSHTCFNQLVLPDYKNREILRRKLTIAIQNAEGFGMK